MKRLISIILIIVMVCSFAGCSNRKQTKSIDIYFKKVQTNELEAVNVKYSGSQNTVDMAKFALDNLISGPEEKNYEKTLPDNTTILSLNIKDEIANVNFSKDFTSATGVDELLGRFSVVRTLCGIPGISQVAITVDGTPLISNATGNEVVVLSKKDVVLDVDIVDSNTQTTTLTLFFATSDSLKLKAEMRKVETQNTISIEKTIISELMKGPSSPELSSVIPTGTKVLNVETKEGICYVNLSQEFVTKFAGGTGMLTVYSIVNSLCSIESLQGVQILIEGEKGAEFGNFVFDEPIMANPDIVTE